MPKTKISLLDFNALAQRAQHFATHVNLHAGAETGGREAGPEELIASIEASGGTVFVERDPDTNEIVSFHATGQRPLFDEVEGDERGDVISSIEASASLPKKITGDLAQTSVGQTLAITGSTTAGSAVITSPSSTTGLAIGQAISGAGIPANTTLLGLSPLTLSANATATASNVSLSVQAEQQVLGLAEWTLDWKRKTADATTTDDAAYESSLGSSASWSAKAKFMFLVGDTSQANTITAAITQAQAPQYWNFFPDVTLGHPAYGGFAFIDGITISAGTGKIVGLDVSLKGTGPLYVGTQTAPVTQPNTVTGQQAED